MRTLGIVLSLFAWLHSSMAQETRLLIKDAITRQSVPYAHVLLEALDGSSRYRVVADMDGRAVNPVEKPSVISVSCMGYVNYLDTIYPGSSHTLYIRPAILEMEAVVVTAQYTPRQADRSIYPVRVISTAKINTKAAVNLRDLLSDELSMRVSQDGALGSNLSLRGLSGEHIKFLIDGVPVIGRMNGNIDLSQLNLNNVEHIEIIEGPMSVIYGSNALAGVVNIITRDNLPGQWRSSLETYTESIGQYNFSGTASLSNKRHGGSLSIARNFFGGWSPEEESRTKLWKPKRQYDGEAWYAYRYDGLRIKASYRYFHELLLNKGALLPPYFETAFDNYFITRRWIARTEVEKSMGEWIRLEGVMAFSGYTREKRTMFKDLTTLHELISGNDEDQDTSSFNSFMARVITIHADPDASLEYQAGVDVNVETGNGKRMAEDAGEIGDYALFTSIKYQPWPSFEIQPGVRYGYNSRYTHPLVYSMHSKWQVTETITLRASYSRGFRAPALKELFLYFVDINHNIRGNPSLEAEYSTNINFSGLIAGRIAQWDWSAEWHLFENRIQNVITLAQLNQNLYTYVNIDHYYSRGAELKIHTAMYPWISFKPGLAITGRSSALEASLGNPGNLRYALDLGMSMNIRPFRKGCELALYYKHVGKLPQLYLNSEGALSEGFIDKYHMMDVSLSQRFLSPQLSLTAGVKNLFDNTAIGIFGGTSGVHSSSGGNHLAGYGRTWFLKANWTLSQFRKSKSS